MNKFSLLIMLMSSSMLAGCVIVRPAAKTLVSVQRNDGVGQELTFGLRHAYWTEDMDGIHFATYGWHPRDHEAYCFFVNEPYYARLFRKIILLPIEKDSGEIRYSVKAQIPGAYIPSESNIGYDRDKVFEYEGELNTYVNKFFDSRTVRFSSLKLYPKDGSMPILLMEGTITAQSDANNKYQSILEKEP